jgi:hypothetical protein
VDIAARQYTLYPMTIEARIAPGYDGPFYASSFCSPIIDGIRGTDLEGSPYSGRSRRRDRHPARVTVMDPGSAADRYLAPFAG